MLRITNFPAAAAAAEEVSSKEKPSPAFHHFPPPGNRFSFWLLAFLHFANLPINKRSIKYAYQPKRALLSDSLPPNCSSSIFSSPLSVYWSQSQNVNKCSRGADFFWILSCSFSSCQHRRPTHKYVGVFCFSPLWSSSFLRLQIPIRCNNSYWQRFKLAACQLRLQVDVDFLLICPPRITFTVRLSKEFSNVPLVLFLSGCLLAVLLFLFTIFD